MIVQLNDSVNSTHASKHELKHNICARVKLHPQGPAGGCKSRVQDGEQWEWGGGAEYLLCNWFNKLG